MKVTAKMVIDANREVERAHNLASSLNRDDPRYSDAVEHYAHLCRRASELEKKRNDQLERLQRK